MRRQRDPRPRALDLRQIRRHAKLVVAVALFGLLAAVSAAAVTAAQATRYRSTSVLVVPPTDGRADNEALVRTLAALLSSQPVAADIAQLAGVPLSPAQVQSRIEVERPPDSAVLNVSVVDTSQQRSQLLARQAGPALTARVNDLSQPPTPPTGAATLRIVPVDPDPSTEVLDPPVLRNGVIALVLGLLVAAGANALRPARPAVITSEDDARRAYSLPVHARLPLVGAGARGWNPLDVIDALLVAEWPPSVGRIAVTGGDSRVSADFVLLLGAAFAAAGRSVTLVDADLERRGLTVRLKADRQVGLVEGVTADASMVAALLPVRAADLPDGLVAFLPEEPAFVRFLPAGRGETSPGLLADARLADLLRYLPPSDVMLVHAPRIPGPFSVRGLLDVSDALLVVAEERLTPVSEARVTGQLVSALTTKPAHVVLLGSPDDVASDGDSSLSQLPSGVEPAQVEDKR